MLDYTDPDTSDVFNNAMRAYGDSLWRPDQWENYFLGYAHLMKPGSKLKVGLYQEYPWSRFTIFDDKSVSFIVTPHVHAEKKLNIYYSEDRYIVDCFLAQFKKIQRSSEERGRIFTSIAEAEKFAKRQSSDSKD